MLCRDVQQLEGLQATEIRDGKKGERSMAAPRHLASCSIEPAQTSHENRIWMKSSWQHKRKVVFILQSLFFQVLCSFFWGVGEKNKQVYSCHRSTGHLHASVETIGPEKPAINSACCIPKNTPASECFQDTAWIVAGSRACSGNEVEWTAWPRLRLKPNQPMAVHNTNLPDKSPVGCQGSMSWLLTLLWSLFTSRLPVGYWDIMTSRHYAKSGCQNDWKMIPHSWPASEVCRMGSVVWCWRTE